jgi:hypothetical protein
MIENTNINVIYFKSDSDISTRYLIELCKGNFEGSAVVKIYTIDVLDNHVTGDRITISTSEIEYIAEVHLFGKYFFPKFDPDLQLYYDDEKYYNGKHKTNQITSLMECINYAIDYGLKTSGIKPY